MARVVRDKAMCRLEVEAQVARALMGAAAVAVEAVDRRDFLVRR